MADPAPEAPRRRVLVVEDEHDIRDLVAGVLEDEGYDVATAAGGVAALEVVQSFVPDVILLDLWMPEFDGASFAAAYRERPGPHAPIIAFTALPDGAEQAARIDAAVYLLKPFHIQDLLRLVQRYSRDAAA
jgi:CheY-like chemotaxis protein